MDQGILAFVFEAAPQPMDLMAFAGLTGQRQAPETRPADALCEFGAPSTA